MTEATGDCRMQKTPVIIEDTLVPVKNPEVTVREELEEDGKYILFNAENELILTINPTGKFILDSCTGDKTAAQIVKEIENSFTVSEDIDLSTVVKNYLSLLLEAELVTLGEG